MEYPEDLLYDKKNCWVRLNGDIAEIGFTDDFVEEAAEFISLELYAEGSIKKGDKLFFVESVGLNSYIESPISGKIIETNKEALDNPNTLLKNPYDSWLVRIRLDNLRETESLLNSNQIKRFKF